MPGGKADLDYVDTAVSIWNIPRSKVQAQIKWCVNSALFISYIYMHIFKSEAKQGLRFCHVSLLNCGNVMKLLCS